MGKQTHKHVSLRREGGEKNIGFNEKKKEWETPVPVVETGKAC